MIAPESREAYYRLKEDGKLRAIDDKVYVFLYEMDAATDPHVVFEMIGGSYKYNAIQQAFTRLKKKGLIEKVAKHKGITGFTRGLYRIKQQDVQQASFF